jgi:hypothetical protein
MIMFVMVGPGYDPQGVADWSGKVERPSAYSTEIELSEIELSPDL